MYLYLKKGGQMFEIKEIKEKKNKLLEVGNLLKKDFVGLDEIIDKVIASIEVWYVFPQLLTRPLIVNLWGMTGVGKTDLVRKLVSYLSFKNEYLEIQLKSSKGDSIQSKLSYLNITSDTQAILLLDEIQRFSSIDEEGKLIRDNGFDDIWELLSDGSFSDAYQEQYELYTLLYNMLYDQDTRDAKGGKEEGQIENTANENFKKERKFKTYLWEAQRFKKITEIDKTVEEIMCLSLDERVDIVNEKLSSLVINTDRKRYKNLLIFVCGNIDEAYRMSNYVSDVDTDADILYEQSKRISLIDIKECLKGKFKPEQIARLGNNHIIYPSLSKKNFQELIRVQLSKIKDKFYELSNVEISYNDKLYDIIYKNGVFPTQGVRPLFSTINSLVENALPEFLLKALIDNSNYIEMSIDIFNSEVVCEYNIKNNKVKHVKKVQLSINDLKKNISKDSLALIAVHEVGHALVYMNNFKTAPTQICCNAVTFSNGFIIPHSKVDCKDSLYKDIEVCLAGKVAEEIVFGDVATSVGSSYDLKMASKKACSLVRNFNMDGFIGCISTHSEPLQLLTNVEDTNPIIEQILKEQKGKVFDIIQQNIKLFKVLVKELLEKKELTPGDLYDLSKDYILDLKNIPLNVTIEHGYVNSLLKFLS